MHIADAEARWALGHAKKVCAPCDGRGRRTIVTKGRDENNREIVLERLRNVLCPDCGGTGLKREATGR